MAGGRASAHKLRLAQRRALAVALRNEGGADGAELSYEEVAAEIRKVAGDDGEPLWPTYSQSQAWRDVQKAIELARETEPEQRPDPADESPELKQRRDMALDLRVQGGSYRQIAATLRDLLVRPAVDEEGEPVEDEEGEPATEPLWPDYDGKAAWRDVNDRLDRMISDIMEGADRVRTLELLRLDGLLATYYDRAVEGDYAAFDCVMRLMGERRRYVAVEVEQPKQSVDLTTGGEKLEPGAAQVVVYIPDNGRDNSEGDQASSGAADAVSEQ